MGILDNLYLVRAQDAVATMQTSRIILTVVALVTLTTVLCGVLPYAIRTLFQTRDATLDMFLSIPIAKVEEIIAIKLDGLVQLGMAVENAGTCICSEKSVALWVTCPPINGVCFFCRCRCASEH